MPLIYEILSPEISAVVRFKVLPVEEADKFALSHKETPLDEYKRLVLENVVFNLKDEVADALRQLKTKAKATIALESMYNRAVAINPSLDLNLWLDITKKDRKTNPATASEKRTESRARGRKITRIRLQTMISHLEETIINQDRAIESVVRALKRSVVGLNDENRPLGVFLFAGASGVGKTYLAREIHSSLFGGREIIRIDCGEYQQKHENQKLIGAPPGYLGHDDGGYLTNAVLKNPNTVILLDEVEKAHPDIWDTFLRVFDEGILTDSQGQTVDFRNTVVIMTTNLGNAPVVDAMLQKRIGFSREQLDVAKNEIKSPPHAQIEREAMTAIRKHFKPEFLNRIDKIIVFNHLILEDFRRIAELELQALAEKLALKGFFFKWDDKAVDRLVELGVSPIQGARGLSQVRREQIEDQLADMLMENRYTRGTNFSLTSDGTEFAIKVIRPRKTKAASVK